MPPLSLLIKPVSGACQYRCRYCFYADVMSLRNEKNMGVMSEATLETLVQKAFRYAEGSVTFAFQGGEPTLVGLGFYKSLLAFEKKYANGLPVYNSIQTNGGLIDDNWAEFFADNGFLVGLSLDGTEELHNRFRLNAYGEGTYRKTVEAAGLFQKHRVQFNILTVVNNDIAKRPTEVYEALRPYGYLQFIPCIDDFGCGERRFSPEPEAYGAFLTETFRLYKRDFDAGKYVSVRNFDNYVQMLMGARPESCAMTGRCTCYFVIEANGDVYPCDFYVLDPWKLGSILTDSFSALLASPRAREFVSSSVYMHPACRVCRHYALCRGGCRRDREPFDDNARPGLNRYCESYKAFFEACGKDLREIAERVKTKKRSAFL